MLPTNELSISKVYKKYQCQSRNVEVDRVADVSIGASEICYLLVAPVQESKYRIFESRCYRVSVLYRKYISVVQLGETPMQKRADKSVNCASGENLLYIYVYLVMVARDRYYDFPFPRRSTSRNGNKLEGEEARNDQIQAEGYRANLSSSARSVSDDFDDVTAGSHVCMLNRSREISPTAR